MKINKKTKIIFSVAISLFLIIYTVLVVPIGIRNIKYKIQHSDSYLCKNAYNELPKSFQFFLDKHDMSIVFIKKGNEFDVDDVLGEYKQSSDNNIIIYKTGDYERDLKTLFHEIAHHFDYDFYQRSPMRISGRADFMKVCIKERNNVFSEEEHHYKNDEYFAWSISEYYTNRNELKERCPKTYEWIEYNIDECEDSYCNYDEYEKKYLQNT